jgi:hypothetical protein
MISKYGTISICIILFIVSIAMGEDATTHYVSSTPLVLHSLPKSGYDRYNNFGVFVDVNDRIIAFYTHKDGEKAFVSIFDSNQWSESSAVIPFSKGMMNNGTFQVYGYEASGGIQICTLSSNAKMSLQPTNKIKDDSRKAIVYLVPLTGTPSKSFAVGSYTESRLNPFNLLPFLLSGGHGAKAKRMFGAIIEKDKIKAYYDVPGPVEENEYVSNIECIMDGNTAHAVWMKEIEYSGHPEVIKYSSFDLSDKCWSKPEELFRGDEDPYKANLYLSPPSLTYAKENAYCVWSLKPGDPSRMDKEESKMEPGIYFRSKTNGCWDKSVKLFNSGSQPRVLVDNFGAVYVFWIEENGLFYKYRTDADWSDKYLAVKDEEISDSQYRGLPPFGFPPLSISVDPDNNLHILYIHRNILAVKNQEHKYKPEKIVYVKLTYKK